MDKVKEKVNALRAEADEANRRAEDSESQMKKFKELLATKENEVNTLNNKIALLQLDLERAEKRIDQVKVQNQVDADAKSNIDTFSRKCILLEEKLGSVEANLKSALDKTRTLEISLEQSDRKNQQYEKINRDLETKLEEEIKSHQETKKEYETTLKTLADI